MTAWFLTLTICQVFLTHPIMVECYENVAPGAPFYAEDDCLKKGGQMLMLMTDIMKFRCDEKKLER